VTKTLLVVLLSLAAISCTDGDGSPTTPSPSPSPAPAPAPASTPSPAPSPSPGTQALATLTLNPTSVQGQAPSTGTVTLTAAAPSGGSEVALATSNIDIARVPAAVTVSAGATTATFTVSTATVLNTASVFVRANYGGITQEAILQVTPPPLVARFTVRSPSAGENRCAIIDSAGRVDCELFGSNSTGAISQYLWTFSVGGRSRNTNTTEGSITPNTDCDLIGNTTGTGSSLTAEITLQVVGRDGVSRSEPVRRSVAVVHNNFCAS
jgi:hypothetical protein